MPVSMTQEELNNFRDLTLSKEKSKVLACRLGEWNTFENMMGYAIS